MSRSRNSHGDAYREFYPSFSSSKGEEYNVSIFTRSFRQQASYFRYVSVLTLNCASRLSQLDSDVPGKILSNFL